ncbi:MAG: hypothetical protein HYZ14_02195 [Bacteroidetes bacterium]|nr:hypothetical protein [Bacteroidota bacterium]
MRSAKKETFRFIYLVGALAAVFWFVLSALSTYYLWELPFYDNPNLREWPLTTTNFILAEVLAVIALLYYCIRRQYIQIALLGTLAHLASIWGELEIDTTFQTQFNESNYYDMVYYVINCSWILFYISILLSYAARKNKYLLVYALTSLVLLSLRMYYEVRMVYPVSNYIWYGVLLAELILVVVYIRAYLNFDSAETNHADTYNEEE